MVKDFGAACLYPFMSLTIAPGAVARLCCASMHSLGDLRQTELEDIWNGKELTGIREDLKSGRQPLPCRTCFRAEGNGIPSKRQKFTENRIRIDGLEYCKSIVSSAQPSIQHLDISFSNYCNLTCATCSSIYSTSWIRGDKLAAEAGLDFRGLPQGACEPTSLPPERIDQILNTHAPHLRTILIKGGEPLLDPSCLHFLRKLAKGSRRPDLSISIQTNGTHLSPEILELLTELKVDVAFSIDGIGEVYRWMRGGSFDRVMDNLCNLGSSPGIQKLIVDFTSSAFNLLHLPSFLTYMMNARSEIPKLSFCFVGAWANQDYLSPRLLPMSERIDTLRRLEEIVAAADGFIQGLDPLARLIQGPRSTEAALEKFRRWGIFCNQQRGFAIESLIPSLAPLLNKASVAQQI